MFTKLSLKTYLYILTLVLVHKSYSQTCCSGGVPLSNNIGLPFLEKGAFQAGVFYDYNNLNTLNEGSRKLDDNSRTRITNSILINFSYNFSERFLIEGLLTWVHQKRKIVQSGNVNIDETNGLGDGIFLFRYMLLNKSLNSLSFGFGAKVPIGSTKKLNNQGILLNADLQPGSNAFDIIATSTYTRRLNFRKSMNFIFRTTYRNTGTNSSYLKNSSYRFGNEFQSFIGLSDQFLFGRFISNANITLKYRNAKNDLLDLNNIANTGGEWLFFNPRISFQISPTISFSTKLEIPIYSNVTGIQLTPSYRINSGISIQFLKKKLIKI